MYKEITGDLIELALKGQFDVIAHGCNCFCTMEAGIAPQMVKTFNCDIFSLEMSKHEGDINKLGTIQYFLMGQNKSGEFCFVQKNADNSGLSNSLYVINAYTQFGFGSNHSNGSTTPLDYEALTLCMRKINHVFKGKHIGLPKIGCGLAGGDWNIVKDIIKKELKDCDVTIVIFK